jgi:hypothetical protein
MNMAVEFAEDFKAAITSLSEARVLEPKDPRFKTRGFTH